MLEFFPVKHPDTIFKFIESHELGSATWIVSDLKSKNEIQKILLQQQGYFLETSILRASDFWKIALRRLAPQVQVVAPDFIAIVVEDFIEKFGDSLAVKTSEVSTLHAYLSELAPILLHSESDSVLSEWFSVQSKNKKWQRWYLLARTCMKYIVFEKNLLDTRWIAAYLQNLNIDELVWTLPVIVDLGTEMSSVEMGLFRSLSKNADVKVLWPQPLWGQRFQFLLKTYQDNVGYAAVKTIAGASDINEIGDFPVHYIRVSTQLAEIKFAVSKIRQWIEADVAVSNIAIVAAEMDQSYWPVLKYFLDEEGLIYQKDHVVKLNSLGAVQNFTSYVVNLMSDVSWDSLETTLFSKINGVDIGFEQFKSLFYQLYDESDLLRDDKIKNLFYQKFDFNRRITRNEFLVQVVKIWSETLKSQAIVNLDSAPNLFETIFKDFLAKSDEALCSFKGWFRFLQSCINGKELKVQSGTLGGLNILPLMSSHLSRAEYQIFLGADEKSVSAHKKTLLPTDDIFELKTKFDFAIDYPEESFYDFNLRWLAKKKTCEKFYLCANSSFEAEPLTPALFFLENNSSQQLQVPMFTRHDQIQNQLAAMVDPVTMSNDGLKRDLFPSPNIVPIKRLDSVSPSDIEEYWKCPFKLLVQKCFRVRDLPQVAVDLDPRHKGSLLHLLFEHLVKPQETASIDQFLETKRADLNIYPQDDLMWLIQKSKLAQIGQQFQLFESSRKKALTSATEVTFEMFFNVDAAEFVNAANHNPNHTIKIRGRVDRIDETSNGIVVYDYKSSTGHLKNHGDWLKEGEFQLILYLLACEKLLYTEKKVIASLYYDYRKFETVKGLMNETFQNTYLTSGRKKKSVIDDETKAELIEKFAGLLQGLLKKLETFDFTAQPVDTKICNDCNWSKLCRAPHLM